MADVQSIGISSLIAIGLVTLAMLSPDFFETQKYYCEDEGSILECPGGISGGQNTRCYLTEEQNSWDYCSSGWIKIDKDINIQQEAKNETKVSQEVWGKSYKCDKNACVEVE